MKSQLILLSIVWLCLPTLLIAQTQSASAFSQIVQYYEEGDYAGAIGALDAFEKARGTSPRLESLRALAYNELGKTVEAYKALQVYFRLTAGRDLSGNEAHQELIRLRNELSGRIDSEYRKKKEKADKEREDKADQIVNDFEARMVKAEADRKLAAESFEKESRRKLAAVEKADLVNQITGFSGRTSDEIWAPGSPPMHKLRFEYRFPQPCELNVTRYREPQQPPYNGFRKTEARMNLRTARFVSAGEADHPAPKLPSDLLWKVFLYWSPTEVMHWVITDYTGPGWAQVKEVRTVRILDDGLIGTFQSDLDSTIKFRNYMKRLVELCKEN